MPVVMAEWPDILRCVEWWPAYWKGAAGPLRRPPDLLVIHSGQSAPGVARYLADPRCEKPKPGEISSDGKRAPGRRLCADGKWRRTVSAHFSWTDGRFYQQEMLTHQAWHAGGSRWRGMGAVNSRSIGIELPGPWDQARPAGQIIVLRMLVESLVEAVPSLRWWVRHSDIDSGKRDPGPGLADDWADGMGLVRG